MPDRTAKHSRIALSAAVATALLTGYGGRQSYAGSCAEGAAGVFSCTGAAVGGGELSQTLTNGAGPELQVSTVAGFGINGWPFAFNLESDGNSGLTFTDNNTSNISTDGDGPLGIFALNKNTNADSSLSITTTGVITVAAGTGIYAHNRESTNYQGLDLTIHTATVNASEIGINAKNDGLGALSITSTGTVTGTNITGINAINSYYSTGNLSIQSTAVNASNGSGIYAKNYGSGEVSIVATDAITVGGRGIFAYNYGTNMLIETEAVVAGGSGIYAYNNSGYLTITSHGALTTASNSSTDYGIVAVNNGTSLTISTTSVTAGYLDGIYAANSGTGALSITSSGAVTGGGTGTADGWGIAADNFGTNLIIDTKAVTGGLGGVSANNDGSGYTDITVDGTVSGVSVGSSGTTSTIRTLATVDGVVEGISAYHSGSGVLSITSSGGGVTGNNGSGIYVRNTTSSTTVNTEAVTGSTLGINAFHSGSGALSITSLGVTGNSGAGIYVRNTTSSTTINTATVTGSTDGIKTIHNGSGALSITSSGGVSGNSGAGIYVKNSSSSTTISTAAVTGTTSGIYVNNQANSTITISSTGDIEGATGILIASRTANNAPATITIDSTATVTGSSGFAINLQGDANDTVNIGANTVINGALDFGNGNDGNGGTNTNDIDTLYAAPGFNGSITIADASGTDSARESAPEVVSSNITLVYSGDSISAVVVDPSGFTASELFLGSFPVTIHNYLDNIGTPTHGTTLSSSFADSYANGLSQRSWLSGFEARLKVNSGGSKGIAGFSVSDALAPYEHDTGSNFWISSFGGKEKVDLASNNAAMENDFSGVMLGVESIKSNNIYGLFGGYGVSKISIESGAAGGTDTAPVFAGGYWKHDYGTHQVNFSVVGGTADHEFRRVVSGSTAKGNADGWFISPSATIGVPIQIFPVPAIASVRMSYSGLFLDAYTETGIANPLDVSARNVYLLNTRLQMQFPTTLNSKNDAYTQLNIRTGIDSQYDQNSDSVTATVGGNDMTFSANLEDKVSVFVGATLNSSNQQGNITLALSGEFKAFDGGSEAVGEAKVILRF